MFKIIKSFNNNVILCTDVYNKNEYILLGKGIGFNAKPGTSFEATNKIEKTFIVHNDKKDNLKELYNSLNPNFIGVATEALSILTEHIDWSLNSKAYIALLDHLVFAIERYYEDIFLENQFKHELKTLFDNEWLLAEKAINFINSSLSIQLNDDEIAFVTMHINGILNKTSPIDGGKNAIIIKNSINFLEDKLKIEIDKSSIYYNRLAIHIKLALNRAIKNSHESNPLLDNIKEKLPHSYNLAKLLGSYLFENYEINLTDEEIGFIALHIDRLVKNSISFEK